MSQVSLYPFCFEPICQYRPWGGRRLANLLTAPLPNNGPIGEAWLLSDRDDHQSMVADWRSVIVLPIFIGIAYLIGL